MSSTDNITFKKLSKEVYIDERLNELEKCVIYQMFTYVGNDMYDENINEYPGKCDRNHLKNLLSIMQALLIMI